MHIVITVLAILAFVAYKIFDFVREKRESRKNKKSKKIKSSNMRLATLLAKDTLGEADLDEIDQIMEDMESELEDDNDNCEEVDNEEEDVHSSEGRIVDGVAKRNTKGKTHPRIVVNNLVERVESFDSLSELELTRLKKDIEYLYDKCGQTKQEDFNSHLCAIWGTWIKMNKIDKKKVDFFNDFYFEDVETVELDGRDYGTAWYFEDAEVDSYYHELISEKVKENNEVAYNMLASIVDSNHNGASSEIIQDYLDNHTAKMIARNPVCPISVNAKIISGEECFFWGELSWVVQRKWQGSPYLDFDNASSVKVYVVKDRIEMLGEAIGHHTIWFEHILDSSISSPDKCPDSLFTIYVRGGKPVFITGERKQIIDLASVVYSLSSDSQKEMVPENSAFEEDPVAVKKEESVLEASPEVEIQPSLQTMNSNQVVDVLERIANVKALIPRNGINKQWIYKQGKVLVHEVYLDGSNSDNNLAADLIFDDNGGAKLLLFTRQYDVNRTKEILEDKTIWGDVNNPAFMGDRYVYKEFPVGTSDEEIARYMNDFVNKMVMYRDKHGV